MCYPDFMGNEFVIKEILKGDIVEELGAIGFEEGYRQVFADKYRYKNLKIFGLTTPQANILKQTALSVGADCATHRDVITGKAELSDCILGGSVSQLQKIAGKLEGQPFGLKLLKDAILAQLSPRIATPKLVGILNLTKNSFSDGGLYYEFENAKEKFLSLMEDGAEIIDIGAESTKPFSEAVSAKDQLEKLLPILDFAKDKPVKISIDTRSSSVAEEVLKCGNYLINDVSGFDYDENMASVVAKYGAGVILQHSQGTPDIMQVSPHYTNLIDEIFFSLRAKIKKARDFGIENIIVDPGIGFGKTQSQNIEIIKRLGEFKSLGYPVMLGASRKSFLGVTDDDNVLKDALTLAYSAIAIQEGVDYLRVHNVKWHRKLLSR